jgi:hypothetical protein
LAGGRHLQHAGAFAADGSEGESVMAAGNFVLRGLQEAMMQTGD